MIEWLSCWKWRGWGGVEDDEKGSHVLTYYLWTFRLHYTWVDIGTPNVSFLVALDAGSDLLWVPCDCIECAPLSANYYNGLVGL